jgi:hypothetical protein
MKNCMDVEYCTTGIQDKNRFEFIKNNMKRALL